MVGTTIEWFDFFIYAQAAGLIFAAQYFNPASDASASFGQIVSWASLGISFLFRPLGAIVAGHLGDRLGRKPVLIVTLVGMGVATMLMGFLPTYETIGVAAPILLVLLRIMQGLSAGGEWGGAALLTVEHAPNGQRGYFGAYPQIGAPAGMVLATVFMLVLTAMLTPEQFNAWGWRIPFLSSVILIVVGYLIRQTVEESPAFAEMQELQRHSSAPLSELLGKHLKAVFACAFIFAGNNAIGYYLIAYFLSYGTKVVGYQRIDILSATLVGAMVWLAATLWSGALSDKYGRRRVTIIGYVGAGLWVIPMWKLVDSGNVAMFYIAVIVLAIFLSINYGPMSALFAEMFPVRVRLSGVSIAYAIGSTMGGAFAPMISEILYKEFRTSLAIAVYCLVMVAIGITGCVMVPRAAQDRDLSV